jgi:hypothetical protein
LLADTVVTMSHVKSVPKGQRHRHRRKNPFLSRKLRPGYKRLMGTLTGGTDSVAIVSEDRGKQ